MHVFSMNWVRRYVAVAIFVFAVGAAVYPATVAARVPDVEIITPDAGGGAAGGGEWRSEPNRTGQIDDGGRPTEGEPPYLKRGSWLERLESVLERMVRQLGVLMPQLF